MVAERNHRLRRVVLPSDPKAFPKSFVGRKLILSKSMEQGEGFTSADSDRYEALVGKVGQTLTTLRPSGMVKLEGKKYSVVTLGEMIQKDESVEVLKVEGNRIVVRKARENR